MLRKWLRSTARLPPSPTPPASVADTFRELCRDFGPHEIAAGIGAPSETSDLRMIAYLFAHAACPEESIDTCVEAGLLGLQEHVSQHR